MYRSVLLALALVAAASVPLEAQRNPAVRSPGDWDQSIDLNDVDLTPWRKPAVGTSRAVEAGDRVRIESDAVSGEFEVLEVSATHLVVRGSDRVPAPRGARSGSEEVRIPMSLISELQISLGARHRLAGAGRGMLIGAGIGAAIGATIGLFAYQEPDDQSPCWLDCSRGQLAGVGALILGLPAGGIGLLLGLDSPGERWQDISPPDRLSIAPSSDGGVALGYEYRF